MRTNKNTHSYRPSTENAYRKTDRLYPDSKPLKEISLEKYSKNVEKSPEKENSVPHITRNKKTIIISSKSQSYRKYHLICQNPTLINESGKASYYDDTCLWNLDLVNPIYSEEKRSISITKASHIISGWTQANYPLVLYITMDGMMGYFNNNNLITDRICALELAEVSSVYDKGSEEIYDLRYEAKSYQEWPIPIGVNSVTLRIQAENGENGEYMKLPITNPIMLEIGIQNK